MNLKNAFFYLLNPRTRIDKLASVNGSDGSDWSRPQLLNAGSSLINLPLVVGLAVVLVLVLITLFGPLWATYDPHITTQAFIPYYDPDLREVIRPPFPPSRAYPFGTDTWGNDLLSLILYGARVTLIAGAYITAVRVILGTMIGSFAGWFANRFFDRLAISLISAVSSIPTLLGAMILILALDIRNGLWVFIVALAILGWTEVAQYIRSQMLIIREMPYIEGAHAVGLNNLQIIVRHALPNILPQVLIMTFLEMGTVLILLAELGFLGVFIGGGTFYTVDIFDSSGPKLLNEVPEWGTLVSIGAPYLRSYPFMVLAPASAFFIAVAGLNALGEGLRQAVERSSVSTIFLLRKRMLLILAAFIGVTALVLKYTGPSLSYEQVAAAFDGQVAYQHTAALSQMEGRGVGQPGEDEAAVYIEEQFRKFGLQPGWKVGINSNYVYRPTATVVRPLTQPRLDLLADDGAIQQSFQHQVDFGYVIDGHGGSGRAEAPLLFIGFRPGEISLTAENFKPEQFDGLTVRGRIVMLVAGNAPNYIVTEVLRRGAQGVLWVTADSVPIRSQIQLANPGKTYLQQPTIPIFHLHQAAADKMLATENVTVSELIVQTNAADQRGPGWFAHSLAARVAMSLQLETPQEVEIPNVMGFLPGYDDNLADQLVVLFAAYDGLGTDPDGTTFPTVNQGASGIAVMLEMARLWQVQNLDPRRSVLFIAWGGGQLDKTGANLFLENEDNFRKLAARVNTQPLKPALVFQLGPVGAGSETLQLDLGSIVDDALVNLLQDSAAAVHVPVTVASGRSGYPDLMTQAVPALSIGWGSPTAQPGQDTLAQIDQTKLQKVGELLTLSLVEILRQVNY